MLRSVESTSNSFVTALIEAGSEVGGGEKRFNTGVMVEVDHVATTEFGFQLFAHAETIVDIISWNDELSFPRAEVIAQTMPAVNHKIAIQALSDVAKDIRGFVLRVKELGLSSSEYPHLEASLEIPGIASSDDVLWSTLWRLAALVPCTPIDKYEFLINGNLEERATRVRDAITHMNDLLSFKFG